LDHRQLFGKGQYGIFCLHLLADMSRLSSGSNLFMTINISELIRTFTGSIKSNKNESVYAITQSRHLRSSCSPLIPSTTTNFATSFISYRICTDSGGIILTFPSLYKISYMLTPFLLMSLQYDIKYFLVLSSFFSYSIPPVCSFSVSLPYLSRNFFAYYVV
jgi:hypothetical protein